MKRARLLVLSGVIPFLLLHQAEDVRLLTQIERDGSGLRLVWTRGNADRLAEVRTRLWEATPNFEDERCLVRGSQFILSRSWRPHSLSLAADADLKITDVAQNPLSLYNTYSWQEKVRIYSDTATASELAGAQATRLLYILEMPGRVDPNSVSPAAMTEGGRVVWELSADRSEYQLTATSRMVRWEILVVLVYVVGIAAVKLGEWLVRLERIRPRRI
jgi:hypothetical protein